MKSNLTLGGLRDRLTGFNEVRKSLAAIEARAQAKVGDAEQELIDVRKVRGWIEIAIDETIAAIREREEAERQ